MLRSSTPPLDTAIDHPACPPTTTLSAVPRLPARRLTLYAATPSHSAAGAHLCLHATLRIASQIQTRSIGATRQGCQRIRAVPITDNIQKPKVPLAGSSLRLQPHQYTPERASNSSTHRAPPAPSGAQGPHPINTRNHQLAQHPPTKTDFPPLAHSFLAFPPTTTSVLLFTKLRPINLSTSSIRTTGRE